MKRMTVTIIVIFGVLALGGVLALRHTHGTAPQTPPASSSNEPTVMDQFQGQVQLDARSDYTPNTAANQKLLTEEQKQRPWEGRN